MELTIRGKRPYEHPQVTIVELSIQPQLLAGSAQSNASMNATYEEEDWNNG